MIWFFLKKKDENWTFSLITKLNVKLDQKFSIKAGNGDAWALLKFGLKLWVD